MEIFTENSPGHRILPSIARLLSQVELVSYCWKPRTQLQKLCSKILMVAINRECYDTNLLLCLTFVHFSCMHNSIRVMKQHVTNPAHCSKIL